MYFIPVPNGECKDVDGVCTCQCNDGYEKEDPLKVGFDSVCIDINECDRNPSLCPDHSKCENTPGSYKCICDEGFKEDEKNGKKICREGE